MKFAHAQLLWLLAVLVPALCLFLFWSWRRRQVLIAQFVQSRLLANLTVGVSQSRQKLRLALLVVAVTLVLVALARPQFGTDWQEARQKGLDILVAIDTSRSMLATDVAPNRLARARLATLDLMRSAKNDRLGLIAFAGAAFLQCPLTLDEAAFRQNVEAVTVGIIPQGGTSLAAAIDTALEALGADNDNHKVLVLFTDGEDHEEGAIDSAKKAAKAGLKIFTIGVGTARGELIQAPGEKGRVEVVKDADGNAVMSHLNETLLQQIATEAGGFYLPLRGAKPIETLYNRGLAPLPKTDSSSKLIRVYREQFRWPLLLAMACLLVEMFLPQRKPARRSSGIAAPAQSAAPRVTTVVTGLVLALALPVHGSTSSAMRLYQEGRYKDALAEYERLISEEQRHAPKSAEPDPSPATRPPDGTPRGPTSSAPSSPPTADPRLHYNAGAAAYRAGHFETAARHFGESLQSEDAQLQQRAFFNLGDSLYQAGDEETDPSKKTSDWENAVKGFEGALSLNPNDADAKANLGLVKQRLEELKKQQQQDKQSGKDDQKNQDSKDQKKDQENPSQKPSPQDQAKNNQDQKDPTKDQEQKSQQGKDKDKGKDNDQDQSGKSPSSEKKDQNPPGQPNPTKNGQPAGEDGKQSTEGAPMRPGEMTAQQARQLLDAQRGDERPLIFLPAQTNRPSRGPLKNW